MAHRKLLVADDSLTIQKVIRLALSGNATGGGDSYEIQTVSDGTSALQQISLFRPDIVLVDVNLPQHDAVALKQAIDGYGDEFKNLRFVLLSSAFEKLDEVALDGAGFRFRLSKPFDPAHLRQVLNSVGSTIPSVTPAEVPAIHLAPPPFALSPTPAEAPSPPSAAPSIEVDFSIDAPPVFRNDFLKNNIKISLVIYITINVK
jgi:CheY-like chemotaxis protein